MSNVVQRLRRIAARSAAGDVLGDDGPWLSEVVYRILAGVPFETAIGKAPGWLRGEAQRRRNYAIGKIADLVAPGGTPIERIRAVRAERRRYEPTWHLRDQYRTEPPNTDPMSPAHWLFVMFQAGASLKGGPRAELVPDSPKQIARILEELSD
jgi:hypothetical protein